MGERERRRERMKDGWIDNNSISTLNIVSQGEETARLAINVS